MWWEHPAGPRGPETSSGPCGSPSKRTQCCPLILPLSLSLPGVGLIKTCVAKPRGECWGTLSYSPWLLPQTSIWHSLTSGPRTCPATTTPAPTTTKTPTRYWREAPAKAWERKALGPRETLGPGPGSEDAQPGPGSVQYRADAAEGPHHRRQARQEQVQQEQRPGGKSCRSSLPKRPVTHRKMQAR